MAITDGIILNDGQRRVVDAGVNHILKGITDYPFEFSGEAGTGKSVVLKKIQEESGIKLDRVAPMAYVGQAAIIMRFKGFPNAKTAHSWLYNPERIYATDKETESVVYNEYLSTPESKLAFIPKESLKGVDTIFIDEGGTMPYSMREDIESHGKPIIVAGDLNQLPPVADKPAYLYDPSKVHVLDEVMRQKADSGIVYLAHRALKGQPIHHGFYGDSLVIYEEQLTDEMIKNANVLLCGTNNTRERLTKLVREEILGYRGTLPNYGEKVICRQNDFHTCIDGIGLGNGLTGTVTSQPDVSDFDGSIFRMDFTPDLFDGTFVNLDIDYEYFIAPFWKKNEMKMRKWAQGYKFDYAYCITTHLSQGGQFPNVIYFEEYMHQDIQNKINYTAITRATNSLIYVKRKKKFFFQ